MGMLAMQGLSTAHYLKLMHHPLHCSSFYRQEDTGERRNQIMGPLYRLLNIRESLCTPLSGFSQRQLLESVLRLS